MKPIVNVILGVALVGSSVALAQQPGQGTAVPKQPVQVAQAGTFVSPVVVVSQAPVAAAPAGMSAAMVVLGVGLVAVGAQGTDGTSSH